MMTWLSDMAWMTKPLPAKSSLLPRLSGIEAFSVHRGATLPGLPYSGFNTCHYVGDDTLHVTACRETLARALGGAACIFPRQTHSDHVLTVTGSSPCQPDDVDALVTTDTDVALCIHTADCVPVVMADPVAGVIAAVHSGWKGTVARIAARTVEAMMALGASPDNIYAAMGPSICCGCFEVGEEVAERFAVAGFPLRIIDRSRPRPHIDLRRAVAATLADSGLLPENIALSAECSRCRPDRWCSARAMGIDSARTLTVIVRRQQLGCKTSPT